MDIILGFKKKPAEDATYFDKIIAWLIQKWTHSEYYHVEVCINNIWITSSTDYGGAYCHNLIPELQENWDYYRYIGKPQLTGLQRQLFWAFVHKQRGTKYDYAGMFSHVFYFLRNNQSKWFCSELVSKVLQLLYIPEFIHIEPYKEKPCDVFNILKTDLKLITNEQKLIT